jgi:outer membrane beta-barrel protein
VVWPLVLVTAVLAAPVRGAETPQVIQPEIERRDIKEAEIDTEDFEVGAFAGAMSVEDFGTNLVWGFRATYHVTEDIFVEAAYGRTDTDETSFERLSGAAQLIDDDDRELTYYNASFGLNLFPGEAFLGKWAFNSAFYLIGGAGVTDFADNEEFTWNIGAGYRLLLTDWFAVRFDGRDHVFQSDVLGKEETKHNLEFTAGVSIYF